MWHVWRRRYIRTGVLVVKRIADRNFRRPRCTWWDNIKMHYKEKGWEGVDFIILALDRDKWRTFFKVMVYFLFP